MPSNLCFLTILLPLLNLCEKSIRSSDPHKRICFNSSLKFSVSPLTPCICFYVKRKILDYKISSLCKYNLKYLIGQIVFLENNRFIFSSKCSITCCLAYSKICFFCVSQIISELLAILRHFHRPKDLLNVQ